ncbi:hypothetical protein VIGAN_09008500 [Vigna angularis var. angularis]|uniref:Uncharacterized protein n=1 Tax=Vigna angularis var. angularis TaxID=157739 RepID=A0A0S3SVF7_PHAAN|nr:hypothetical protein VIGAN_09008500 [Vigna angularis var. angularis]
MKEILNELSEMQGKKIEKRTKKKTGIMSSTLSMQHELIKHECRVFPSSLIVIALRSSVQNFTGMLHSSFIANSCIFFCPISTSRVKRASHT